MSAKDDVIAIYNNYLHLGWSVFERQGQHINVGERFTLRITLHNSAAGPPLSALPIFRDPSLFVMTRESPYASVVDRDGNLGDSESFPFPNDIGPGQTTFVDVEFEAEQNMGNVDLFGWLLDFTASENIASLRYEADLRVGGVRLPSFTRHVNVEIEPT